MPTANAERSGGSEGGIGKVPMRRVFWVPSDRHQPSAFAVGMLRDIKKKVFLATIKESLTGALKNEAAKEMELMRHVVTIQRDLEHPYALML